MTPADSSDGGGRHRVVEAIVFRRGDPLKVLLLRRTPQRGGWWQAVTGSVEAGEGLEAAVRREVFEEAGIRVGKVDYLASQPWPFPSSLMLGCAGAAQSREIVLDENELADARWVSREEMVQVFSGMHPELSEPRRGAIAHSLLQAWLADRLS